MGVFRGVPTVGDRNTRERVGGVGPGGMKKESLFTCGARCSLFVLREATLTRTGAALTHLSRSGTQPAAAMTAAGRAHGHIMGFFWGGSQPLL